MTTTIHVPFVVCESYLSSKNDKLYPLRCENVVLFQFSVTLVSVDWKNE